jgi:hypothetical protein
MFLYQALALKFVLFSFSPGVAVGLDYAWLSARRNCFLFVIEI